MRFELGTETSPLAAAQRRACLLRLSRRRCRRQAVTAHDLRHLRSVRRTTGCRVDHLGTLAEILRPDRSWRDHAKRLYVLHSMVIEPVNRAARNAECLSRPNLDLSSVDRPGQDSVEAIDRLFEMVVAMRRCRQALRTRDNELKGRDAAMRVFSGD